jgi:hypothetical protein
VCDVTINHDLLTQLRQEWVGLGRTRESQRAGTAFALRHCDLALAGVKDLADVVGALEARSGRSVEQRAAIVAALLQDAGQPMIHRALLQTLLPGVVSVARQLQFGRGIIDEPGETMSQAITTLSELISDWSGELRPYAAPDLLSALRGRLRRWLLKEKQLRSSTPSGGLPDAPAAEEYPILTRLAQQLSGPNERLARLCYARVFEERSFAELAATDGTTPQLLRGELQQFATRFLL